MERFFKTDSLRRLYDWQNIVIHRGIRIDDYLLWFVCERTALEILAAFNANLKHYRDQILEELRNEEEIQIKYCHYCLSSISARSIKRMLTGHSTALYL